MYWKEVWTYTNVGGIYRYREVWEMVEFEDENEFTCTKCNCRFKTAASSNQSEIICSIKDIHKVIGKLPFKPKKGFVLPKHRSPGPFNPPHLQLDSKDKITHYRDTSRIMLLIIYQCIMTSAIGITIHRVAKVNVTAKC